MTNEESAMHLARNVVNLSRKLAIDPFIEDASNEIDRDIWCNELKGMIRAYDAKCDATAILQLLLQALEIESNEPRGCQRPVECVATLPNACLMPIRPTRIVIREMLMDSRRSVFAAGYLITEGSDLLPLAQQAAARGVKVTLVCDRSCSFMRSIVKSWPSTISRPIFLVNRDADQALEKMHAKVLITDDENLLSTSANFTWSGQAGNIEYGLKVSGAPALTTSKFFQMLQQTKVLEAISDFDD